MSLLVAIRIHNSRQSYLLCAFLSGEFALSFHVLPLYPAVRAWRPKSVILHLPSSPRSSLQRWLFDAFPHFSHVLQSACAKTRFCRTFPPYNYSEARWLGWILFFSQAQGVHASKVPHFFACLHPNSHLPSKRHLSPASTCPDPAFSLASEPC